MGAVISIIASLVVVGVILLLIKVADRGAPTQEENEKKRKESDEITKWANEHPEEKEELLQKVMDDFGIDEILKKVKKRKDEQNNKVDG